MLGMRWRASCLATGLFALALQQPPAAAAPDGDWLDRLSAFKCKHSIEFDAPSVDPLLFTMIAACWRNLPRPEPHQGPYALIALDAARRELRVLRISAFNSGGIHYAGDGRIIWFSELNEALVGQEQRFVEAFSLEPQALEERSLGRMDLPFVVGSSSMTRGADCHVLRIASRAVTGGPPVEHRFLLFDDRDPIGSSRALTGIEHVLFFEPQSRVFVVELVAGNPPADTVQRAALDCSAQVLPLDDALARRLAQADDWGRRYWAAAPTGEVLSTGYTPGERRALLFRGEALTRFPPVISCFDPTTCDSYFAAGRGWSPSGDHFALLQYGGVLEGTLEVYRTADLAVVHARPWDLYDRFLFTDDEAVYFVTRRGRFVRDAWR
jgi:hypothetical protein